MLHLAQHFARCTLHISLKSRVRIYSLMYSFSYLGPVCCSMSNSNYCFLTCIQISQEAASGGLILPSPEEFSTVYCDPHSQRLWRSQWGRSRCFSVILLLCLWSSGCWQLDLWFKVSAFSKSSVYIWKFLVHILLQPSLKDLENYFASMWNECNYVIVWTFSGIALL